MDVWYPRSGKVGRIDGPASIQQDARAGRIDVVELLLQGAGRIEPGETAADDDDVREFGDIGHS